MAAKTSASAGNKSDAIRAYLSAHPEASQKEIAAALAEQGVKASSALINKIKYSGNKSKRGPKAKRGPKPKAAAAAHSGSNGDGGMSKAQAIRDAFASLGRRARPRDVIAQLRDHGTVVSAAQVSSIRKSLKKNGRPPGAATASSAQPSVDMGISLRQLLAAKKLADDVGIDAAKRAIDILARLAH